MVLKQSSVRNVRQRAFGTRGQLTLFIIVGLLILISVATALYIQRSVRERGQVFAPIIDEVPREFAPLRNFIDTCLRDSALEGLQRIGMHGGYIGLTAAEVPYTGRSFDVDYSGASPASHGAITFSPGSNWHIPYWYYLSADNQCSGDCQFAIQRPPLYRNEGDHSIEEQLDDYVRDRTVECLGSWEAFTVQGFRITGTAEPEVRTVIAEQDVQFYLRYPIEAVSEFGTRKFANFGVRLDLNLPQLYDLATEILNTQVQGKVFEANTMNVIAGMSGLDEDALPPVAATEFSHSPRFWAEAAVQKKVQDLLSVHLQRFTVLGTKNFNPYIFPDDPIKQGLYQSFILPVQGRYPDLEAEFTYLPSWTAYFDAGPSMISTSGAATNTEFPLVPIKQYNTAYDISYPVVIELADPDALQQRGYRFVFALEANIRNNQAIDEEFVPLAKATIGGSGQFCNMNQRNSGDILVQVRDGDGNPVPDAAVFFSAGTSCLLGATDGQGEFRAKFPIGIGAITATAADHQSANVPYATKVEKADTVGVTLHRIVEKPAQAYKKNIVKQGKDWVFDSTPRLLNTNEQAIIIVTKIPQSEYEEDFIEMAQVRGAETGTIRLIPGTYNVQVQLIADDTYVNIPKTKICKKKFGIKKCVTVPEIKLAEGTFFAGDTAIGPWTVSELQLQRDSQIRFHALNFAIADVPEMSRHPDDLKAMGKLRNYSEQHLLELLPTFVGVE